MNAAEHELETAALRDRLSRLSEASLRINESLDLDTVLQEVVDSARALTGSAQRAILEMLKDAHSARAPVTLSLTGEAGTYEASYDVDGLRQNLEHHMPCL